jgi:hypothetical protein
MATFVMCRSRLGAAGCACVPECAMDLLGMVEIAGYAWCAPDHRRTAALAP